MDESYNPLRSGDIYGFFNHKACELEEFYVSKDEFLVPL